MYYFPLSIFNFCLVLCNVHPDSKPLNKSISNNNILEKNLKMTRDIDVEMNNSNNYDHNNYISIIIPCYNESSHLLETLRNITSKEHHCEIIISDGGSKDNTIDIANEFSKTFINLKIVSGGSTRSECLNLGALQASHSLLLFLHADTILPSQWGTHVRDILSKKNTLIGAFSFGLKSDASKTTPLLNYVPYLVNIRSRYLSLPYGDQGIFIRKSTFYDLEGFPSVPLMEDYDLVVAARNKDWFGVVIADVAVQTSARRWEYLGVLNTFFINQLVLVGNICGVPRHRIQKWYYGLQKRREY